MLGFLNLHNSPGDRWRLPRGPIWAVAGFSFGVNLLLLMPALFTLQVFDRVFSSGSSETLVVLVIGVAVALLISLALDHLRSRLQGLLGGWLAERLLPDVVREVIAARAKGRRNAAASVEPLRDVSTLRALFSAQGLLAVFDAPWAVVYIVVIAIAHPVLGAAAALAAVVMLGLAVLNNVLTRQDIETVQQDASTAQRYLEGSIANAEVAEAMGLSDSLVRRWRKLNSGVLQRQWAASGRIVGLSALTRMTRQAVQVGITAVGAYLVITKSATPGVMVATTILLGRALAPVELIVANWKTLVEGHAAGGRLRTLLAPLSASGATPMPLPPPEGKIDAVSVLWKPPGSDRLILQSVGFSVAAGESVAVVGPSGAGKSTLLRLVAGLWAPTAGSIRLDGAEASAWPRQQLGPHIGYVPQDVELFAGTVAENIARLGDVDSEAIVKAARDAGVHEMILSLPGGYDTPIEPSGGVFSPGQRQRIALARALYGQPRLLLLDEPNSNLDGAGEIALGEALSALRGQVTIMMVTHRSTLVQHADKLLALEAGRVRHFGPVAEVLQAMQSTPGLVVPMPRPVAA